MPTRHSLQFQLVPSELTEHILTFCHPRDVARVAQTCKQFRSLVYDAPDQYLWRELFLLYPFDDLRKSVAPPPPAPVTMKAHVSDGLADLAVHWRAELQRRVHAEVVALADPESRTS